MFAWVGTQFDIILSTYLLGVVSALMSAITPIALSVLTLWILLYGWAVLRNEVSEPLNAFVWKVTKIGFVFAFALQSAFYIDNVADTANALAMGVASTFMPSISNPLALSSPYALLDAFNDRAGQLTLDLIRDAGITRLDLMFAAVVVSIGNVIFLIIALFVITLAKLFMTFVIAVGPLFILCLAWRPTARFFDSWLSMVLNAVVLTWFAFFALGLSVHMGDTMVQAVQGQGGIAGPNLNAIGESLRYCVVMILMAIICFQAPNLASGLTGGAAVQQGIQMVQNAMMVAGLRSRSAAGPAAGGQGGVVRPGTGAAYAAGQAVGPAATVASRALSSGAGAVRTAAYKLAALRGRDRQP